MARQATSPTTNYRRIKRLSRGGHTSQKPLYQAVSGSRPSVGGTEAAVWNCIKYGIFIDPPYNTGSDFIYPDNFVERVDEFLERDSQYDEQGNRLTPNFDSNGRFHTDWLNMLYPRLRIARDLLADDGVIFISIDDNEVAQLRKICDEIFGSINFVNCISVKLSEPSGVKMAHTERRLPKLKEYVLVYGKNGGFKFNDIRLDKEKWDDEYHTLLVGLAELEMAQISDIVNNVERSREDVALVGRLLKKASYMGIGEYFRSNSILSDNEKDEFKRNNAWRIFQTVSMGSGTTDAINLARDNWQEQTFFPHITSGGEMYIIKGDYDQARRKPRIQVLFAKDYLTYHPCDFWTDIKTTGLDNEGGITFKSGKKPLALLRRLIDLLHVEDGGMFLDFFSGSGH
jgi:adenine-specific DNA-methyltransferase